MQIKNTHRPFSGPGTKHQILKAIGITFVVTLLLVGIVGLLVLVRVYPHRFEDIKRMPGQIPRVITNYVSSLRAKAPVMQIDIGHLAFQELSYMREQALKGYDFKKFTYVPAAISWKGEQTDVKLRLKGDRYIHFEHHHKWSFRVKVKNDTVLNGMRWFSRHRAGARNYIHEWLFHQLLSKEGFVALKYEFVHLYVNGTSLGIYAMEEHFDRPLIERHQHRDGPILKFDESVDGFFLSLSAVQAFDSTRWQTPDQIRIVERATNLLEQFREGRLSLSEVFEVEQLATYFALADLLRMHHGQLWKSMRFYYNPVTSRISPIGYDGHLDLHSNFPIMMAAEVGIRNDLPDFFNQYRPWFRLLFYDDLTSDTTFFAAYLRALDRISSAGYLESFFEEIEPELNRNMAIIRRDLPATDHVQWFGPDFFGFRLILMRNSEGIYGCS